MIRMLGCSYTLEHLFDKRSGGVAVSAKVIPLVSRAALAGRIALARSLLSHRPWCPDCQRHADLVDAALTGESIEDLTRREGA